MLDIYRTICFINDLECIVLKVSSVKRLCYSSLGLRIIFSALWYTNLKWFSLFRQSLTAGSACIGLCSLWVFFSPLPRLDRKYLLWLVTHPFLMQSYWSCIINTDSKLLKKKTSERLLDCLTSFIHALNFKITLARTNRLACSVQWWDYYIQLALRLR